MPASFLLGGLSFWLSGCGGNSSVAGALPIAPTQYAVDPSVTIYNNSLQLTGTDSSGAWVGIVPVYGEPALNGYTVNGMFSAFPQTGVPSDAFAMPYSAGGHYVWATYISFLSGSPVNYIAILDMNSGAVKTVTGYTLFIPGAVSADGTSALISSFPGPPVIVTALGEVKPIKIPASVLAFEASARSNTGFTAGTVLGSGQFPSIPRATSNVGSPLANSKRPQTSGGSPLGVLEPDGRMVMIQGSSPTINAIDDQGNTCGYDTSSSTGNRIAVRWDAEGKEHLLQQFDPTAANEVATGLSSDGYIVGSSQSADGSTFTGVIWSPNGTVKSLTSMFSVSGGITSIAGGVGIQSANKLLVYSVSQGVQTFGLVGVKSGPRANTRSRP